MSEILCISPLIRGTEFFLNDQGVRLFGTCGERALASAASSVLNTNVNPLGIYDSMLAHSWADPGGASTIDGLFNQAKLMNLSVAGFQGYGEPWSSWYAWCKAQVIAGNPTVVETANGQALVDSISGAGENAQNLQYHFIALLGYFSGGFSPRAQRDLPEGFWAADGDSFAGGNNNANSFNAANVLQFYPVSVLAAARLCAGLALKGKAIVMAWTELPDGSGKDDHGKTCGAGDYHLLVRANKAGVDGLFSETYPDPSKKFINGSVFGLQDGTLILWDATTNSGSVTSDSPHAAYFVEGLLNLLAASASVVPVSAPTPAPVSTEVQAALSLAAAVKAVVAAN